MTTQSTFPLSLVCDVSVSEASVPVSGPAFNQGMVLGSSPVIPSFGVNPRVRLYNNATALLNDGFNTNSPEYIAAQIYFEQVPTPNFLWVGRLDLTAIQTAIAHSGNAGTGYVVGDIVTVVQSGASFGQLRVNTIGGSGAVTGLAIVAANQGTGYSDATGLATTGGSGTGLEVDITGVGETAAQAAIACRAQSGAWYAFCFPQGVAADHVALANWAAETDQQSYYVYETADANAASGATGNVFSTINAENIGRNFGVYSTTQGGLFLNNPYAAAAIIGQMMARNTGLPNSAFSLFYKTLAGITTEPITPTTLDIITANGGNAYISIANAFVTLNPGVGPDGQSPDEQMYTDMLVTTIQYAIANAFTAYPKIPQTDPGEKILLTATAQSCAQLAVIGFIAPGIWAGQSVLKLETGDSLPLGYKVQADRFSTQSSSDRAAHKMMPIIVSVILAGSGRSIAVTINVQR